MMREKMEIVRGFGSKREAVQGTGDLSHQYNTSPHFNSHFTSISATLFNQYLSNLLKS